MDYIISGTLVFVGLIASFLFYSLIYRAIACLFRIEKQLLSIQQQISASQESKDMVMELRALRADLSTSRAVNSTGEFYFLDEQGLSQGPFSADQLRSLYRRGTVRDETPVSKESQEDWVSYRDFVTGA